MEGDAKRRMVGVGGAIEKENDMKFAQRILTLFTILVAASCISVNIYPQRAPLTFDALEDSVRILMPGPTPRPMPPRKPKPFIHLAHVIAEEANRAGIDPQLLAAVVQHESGGDSLAINHIDPAYGLGQVMPKWWRTVFVEECGTEATPTSLLVARTNLCYTAHILAFAQDRFGSRDMVLSYYNTGTPHRGITNGYVDAVVSRLDVTTD